ncbi:hypothetical protein D3C87_2174010 [compost metagenome]
MRASIFGDDVLDVWIGLVGNRFEGLMKQVFPALVGPRYNGNGRTSVGKPLKRVKCTTPSVIVVPATEGESCY